MKHQILFGLGNPGSRYRETRHNVGFNILDAVVKSSSSKWNVFRKAKFSLGRTHVQYEFTEYRDSDITRILVKPHTFMNNSGVCVLGLIEKYAIALTDFLIICDDVHLPLGTLRVRPEGTSGGQNGLQSVIDAVGSQKFSRLRMGVGKNEAGDLSQYVLETFQKREQPLANDTIELASKAVEYWLDEGTLKTMNRYNQKTN